MLRWLTLLLALVPIVILGTGFSEVWLSPSDHLGMPSPGATPSPASYPVLDTLLAHASDQVKAGAGTFHLVCATCHGPTGGGLAEARLAFDPMHRTCERCHDPANPPLRKDMRITPRDSFSLGHPPALRTDRLAARFKSPSDLYAFLRSNMPRYDPGMLSDRKYVQLTAFLLALNGAMPASASLTGAGTELTVSRAP